MFTREDLEVIFDMLSYCCTEHPSFVEEEQEKEKAVLRKVYDMLKLYEESEEV